MNCEPRTYCIEDLIQSGQIEIGDGYRAKNSELSETGIPFARAGNINDGFKFSNADYFPESELWRVGGKVSRAGDVVFTSKGTVGRFALVETHSPRFVYSPQLCYWRSLDRSTIHPEYLYYWMSSEEFLHQIGYLKGQTDMADYVSLRDQRRMTVTIPPLKHQLAIVACLKPLDDRIALLRETNATLEAIAQALFKSWFVDFDPVRAKAEGRFSEGLDADTAALFPDRFEESALGLVPRGWECKAVSDVAEITKGKSYTSAQLIDSSDTALVTLKSFERGGGFRLDGFKGFSGPYRPAQIVLPGDLIVAYTDVTQAAELIGKPAIVVGVEKYKTLVASLDVGIIRAKANMATQFLYGLFRTEPFQAHTFSHTSGTTVLHLSKEAIGSYRFVCPPFSVTAAFGSVINELALRRQVNIDCMRTMIDLRDTLLPRLISGQLRLPEAEALLETAA